MDAVNEILGKRVDKKTINEIKKTICKIENVYGAYDLMLHNYGPDKYYGSVHVELPDTMNVDEVDYISREITDRIMNKFGIIIHTVGVYIQWT